MLIKTIRRGIAAKLEDVTRDMSMKTQGTI